MKIICIGRNYAEHAKELGNEIPDEPVIFMKPKSALLQPHTPFYYPEFTNELNYECELVLRVCKNGKYINEAIAIINNPTGSRNTYFICKIIYCANVPVCTFNNLQGYQAGY